MKELIKDKVYYKFFDFNFKESSHIYRANNSLTEADYFKIIQKNRQAIINYYQAENIVILKQIHSNKIINFDLVNRDTPRYDEDLEADGVITTKKNLILAIQTADCVPVLLSSIDGKLIGAVHSGWRGAKAGIIQNIVNLMRKKGANEIYAIIGPAIQQYSYEVDQKFYNDFIQQDGNNDKFFIHSDNPSKYMFDLPSYTENCLLELSITRVKKITEDTYNTLLENPAYPGNHNSHLSKLASEERRTTAYKYPSHRRCSHAGIANRYSILSTIIIR